VIAVEGFFGKKKIDDILQLTESEKIKCIATFGKKISNHQILKLVLKGVKKIILFYDNDAVQESKKYCSLLSKFFNVEVAFLAEKGKDPADLTDFQIIDFLTKSQKLTIWKSLLAKMVIMFILKDSTLKHKYG
jgi:DNA primase